MGPLRFAAHTRPPLLATYCLCVACSPGERAPQIGDQEETRGGGDAVGPRLALEAPDAGATELDAGAFPIEASAPAEDAGTEIGSSPVTAEAEALNDSGPRAGCGDGQVDDDEECDSSAGLDELSCEDLGFTGGELSCTAACRFNTAACSGVESCSDGRDNDGDMLSDCLDEDCVVACASACAGVVEVSTTESPDRVVRLEGSNAGHSMELTPSCGSASSGRETAYRVVPTTTGRLQVDLESPALLVASIRSGCAPSGEDEGDDEFACALTGRTLLAATTIGEPLYVVVDGFSPDDIGPYSLLLTQWPVACGDGSRDGSEQCDDGNIVDTDGCTNACELNRTESEPNDSAPSANTLANPFYGEIDGINDVDFVRFTVTESSEVTLRVVDFGNGECAAERTDPTLQVLDDSGDVVGENDDGGDGFCAELSLAQTAPGDYYVAVAHGSVGDEVFPYRLTLVITPNPDTSR